MPTKKFGTMRMDYIYDHDTLNSCSENNCISDDADELRQLIMKKVRESENIARTGQRFAKGEKIPKYLNNIIINWPPEKEDFKNLCKAINVKIDEKVAYEAMIFSKGPKMNKENFSFERLIVWLQKNLKHFYHYDLSIIDPKWIRSNPNVLKAYKIEEIPKEFYELKYSLADSNSPQRLKHPVPHKA